MNLNVIWVPLSDIEKRIPPSLYRWIADSTSTTQRFKQDYGPRFFLNLITQSEESITLSEAKALSTLAQTACVRAIVMGVDNIPWLVGRTVFHPDLLASPEGQVFVTLRNRPLGEILYREPTFKRERIEVALIEPYHKEHHWIQNFSAHAVWARRSLLRYKNYSMVLTEFFLPESYV